jgi:trehalose 6-phosphate synthase
MRLIVVSNRGPVSFARDDQGARCSSRGGGGLATALRGLLRHHEVTWIASAMTDEDRVVASEGDRVTIDEDGLGCRVRLIAHEAEAYDGFYNVIANPLLWFVQHYLWGLAREPDLDAKMHDAWWEGYVPVNRAFAEAVLAELAVDPGAAVFFHDYHLYLAPAFVRAERPEARLAHFVHIPWPQSDYWHVLPEPLRRAVHEGLLANDVVGFHTDRWRRNFLRSCADLLDARADRSTVVHAGRRSLVTSHAISIDPAEFEMLAGSAAVLAAERELESARPEQLVLRVDRTDPSKNIVRGFRALALLLDTHPEHRGRVTMLALLDPSRQDIPVYSEYLAAIETEARLVNERFGDGAWLPVDLRVRDDFKQTVAAYRQYDVLFVNAVYDGLNLVAKEGPLVNCRSGVVVLSENAGAYDELAPWVLPVSPFDVQGQADALHEALTMGASERDARADGLRGHVRENGIGRWVAGLVDDLERITLSP